MPSTHYMSNPKDLDFNNDQPAFEVDKKTAIEIQSYTPNYAGSKLKYGNVTREYLLEVAGASFTMAGKTLTLPSREQVKEDLDNYLFYNAIYRDYSDSFETTLGEKFYEEISDEFKEFLAKKRIALTYFRPKRKDLRIRPQSLLIETPYLDQVLYMLGFDLTETKRLVLRTGKTLAERSPDIWIRSDKFPSKGYLTNVVVGRLRDNFKHKSIYSDDWNKASEGILKLDPKDMTKLFNLCELDFDIEENDDDL